MLRPHTRVMLECPQVLFPQPKTPRTCTASTTSCMQFGSPNPQPLLTNVAIPTFQTQASHDAQGIACGNASARGTAPVTARCTRSEGVQCLRIGCSTREHKPKCGLHAAARVRNQTGNCIIRGVTRGQPAPHAAKPPTATSMMVIPKPAGSGHRAHRQRKLSTRARGQCHAV